MSSTIILINNTSAPYKLNTNPSSEGDPWPRETYFVQNIVAGPNQNSDIVQVNREKHIKRDHSYILESNITNPTNEVLFTLSVKVEGTLLSSDISANLKDASGSHSTGWFSKKDTLSFTLNGVDYEVKAFFVSDFPSLFDNLEVHLNVVS